MNDDARGRGVASWRCAQLILDSTSALVSFRCNIYDVNSLVIVLASK